MGLILFDSILFVVATYFWGNWKNWKSWYTTILFVISVSLLHKAVTSSYILWKLQVPIPSFHYHALMDFLCTFIVLPATVILYMTFYPNRFFQRGLYVLFWTGLFVILEGIALWGGFITYDHGWTFTWSVVIDVLMFLLIPFHHTRPLYAWIAAFLISGVIVAVFDIPLANL